MLIFNKHVYKKEKIFLTIRDLFKIQLQAIIITII